ncbi:endonuclease domain-containing 1 protein-like [Enoplosus armatus]|uniref:endonuclease domain-containing 1 protein-like n=1 Tax=Enoplosus armatus TaxID=215367 RepID=UPI0039925A28
MTSPKRWCLLPLAAFLLLSFVPTVAKVVDSMSDCAEFLLEKTPPQVPGILEGGNIKDQNRYKPICQTFKNDKRFVTLYDTQNKIPVFSAYKYRGEQDKGRPRTPWKIEPELEERNTNNMRDDRYIHQASDMDYKNVKGYNRGHLFPTSHAFDKNDKISTFTLTNIVPQAVSFNSGSWQKMEKCIKCVLQKYCINNNDVIEGFVVTGAKPSSDNKLNNKINIPSILWSAFCCYSHNMKKWLASAHWGNNIAEQSKSKYLPYNHHQNYNYFSNYYKSYCYHYHNYNYHQNNKEERE